MSQLEPGASYVYERDGSRIYARKTGGTNRILIGEDFVNPDVALRNSVADEWIPIILAAEQNPALQEAVERVKILYALTREETNIEHHPV